MEQTHSREAGPSLLDRVPLSADLVQAFQREGESRSDSGQLLDLASCLAAHHLRQWAAEDESRSAAGDRARAAAKSAIDMLNARRVALVERVDDWVTENVLDEPAGALHTETLGSVVDRLAIAWVRHQQLSKTSGARRREPRLALRQLNELADAYDALVYDLAEGRRRLPGWRPLKRYGLQR